MKGNKNDFVDAEGICEAAIRPAMRFVTPKTEAQRTLAALHRVREGLVRERTATVNRIHGILLEFGISLRIGMSVIERLPATLSEHTLPPRLVQVLERLHTHFKYLDDQVKRNCRSSLRKTTTLCACLPSRALEPLPPACWPLNWGMQRILAPGVTLPHR
ncbi:hypothetical protein CBM2634_U610004 [Cupriavidus taiwanensis]|uniref:Transposase IS110-like N-terminal domain-containing protein n=1 Tax=Cupriavidus taiwanensis TaxID=164546 RepID=A0A375JD46_9BURK|nr:hypothetical protein CBM2634_U610004 [Cupriavidus taiwanensis]